jgi:hypothetical protein
MITLSTQSAIGNSMIRDSYPAYYRPAAERQIRYANSEAEEAQATAQKGFIFDEGNGLSTKEQQYDPTSIINEVRGAHPGHRQALSASRPQRAKVVQRSD